VWLDRLVREITRHPGPVVLEGGERYGTLHLLAALAHEPGFAWVHVTPPDANDFVAQGNRLAEAVNLALGSTLLHQALPFRHHLEALKTHVPILGPLTIALSNAALTPFMAESLLEFHHHIHHDLHHSLCKVVIEAADVPFPLPEGCLHLTPDRLALTLDEARIINQARLDPEVLWDLWHQTGGAYHAFQQQLHQRLRLEPPLVPTPHTNLLPVGHEVRVAPEVLLDALLRAKRYTDALDLAVMSQPERVEEVVHHAGPVYQEQGLLGRLHRLLESLDEAYQCTENVLAWRLVAAASQGDLKVVLEHVQRFLAAQKAPELRARYAGVVRPTEAGFVEAARAVADDVSPLTLFQLGRLHPDLSEGARILQESVRLAEAHGRPYDVVRNSGTLGEKLLHLGRYKEASDWLEWAMRHFDRHALKDGTRHLLLMNNLSFARLLTGELVAAGAFLREATQHLEHTLPVYALLYRSTLAEYELVSGHADEALRLCEQNVHQCDRRALGLHTVPLVRTLLELGDTRRAVTEAQRALRLTEGEEPDVHLPARLAYGMALAFSRPAEATDHLRAVLNVPFMSAVDRSRALLHLLLASRHTQQNIVNLDEHRHLLQNLSPVGVRLLAGPEHAFSDVHRQLLGVHEQLHVHTLGTARVTLEGKPVPLSNQLLEVVALLALSPEGLTAEQLHDQLFGEETDTKLVSLRATVSRLRQVLPIESKPYRLGVPYVMDYLECLHLVQAGRLREALNLYRGPFLPRSDAPHMRELRGDLEEQLRQAVMVSGDAEALFLLATVIKNDLELWQASLGALHPNDPRHTVARARFQRLKREYDPLN
jgi:tetratricopeptide (TPR) repeat protein